MIRRAVTWSHSAILSLIFAIVFTAQVLGFVGAYVPLPVLLLTLAMTAAGVWLHRRFDNDWHTHIATGFSSGSPSHHYLDYGIVVCAVVIFAVVFVSRMALWTESVLAQSTAADFYGYHAIKALELARTGSYWNLAVPFGQYPIGYEALLSFPLVLTDSLSYTGAMHALGATWLWLTLILLVRRYARLSMSVSIGIGTALLFVPFFYSTLLVIGKNDVLLSTTILSAILHAPFGDETCGFHPIGLAFATMISIATKGNGLYILLFIWLLVLFYWWQAYRRGKAGAYLSSGVFALCIGLMFPGGLWVIRNYVVMGQAFSPEVANFFTSSILASLDRPELYTSGSESVLFGLYGLVSAGMMAIVAWSGRFRGAFVLLLFMLVLSFTMTPLGAFRSSLSTDLHIEWRYILHGLLLYSIIVVTLLRGVIDWIYQWMTASRLRAWLGISVTVVASWGLLMALDASDFFTNTSPSPLAYPQDSIYEYVDETITEGAVEVYGAEWFYVTYANPNLVVRQGESYPLGLDVYERPDFDYLLFIGREDVLQQRLVDDPRQWRVKHREGQGVLLERVDDVPN